MRPVAARRICIEILNQNWKERCAAIADRRQTYLDEAIDLNRISLALYCIPARILLVRRHLSVLVRKSGVSEGPAVLENTVVGENAEIASGYLRDAVMLRDTRRNIIGGRSVNHACCRPEADNLDEFCDDGHSHQFLRRFDIGWQLTATMGIDSCENWLLF
jgi:hypothetical protein